MRKLYLALFLSMFWTSTIFAVEYQTIDGIEYELDASTNSATVTGTPSGAVVIPASVKYNNRTYNVTKITSLKSSITSLVVPEGVTTIVAQLCSYQTLLTSVTLPSTIQRIEDLAFKGCSSLISINLPEGLTYIGQYAFADCSVLPSITIPSTLTSMGDNAFQDSKNLTKIVWKAKHCVDFTSESVAPFTKAAYNSNTGDYYYYNNYTTSIEFGEEVEYIPAYLCRAFMNLSTITIPNNVKEIGQRAFLGYYRTSLYTFDSKLQSVKFGTGLEKIGAYAFVGRKGLASITIPDNCTEIGTGVFGNCDNLQNVTLGKNISIISDEVFNYDNNLNTINIYANIPPAITAKAFETYPDLKAITLNVRSGAYDAYKAANVWKDMYIQVLENDLRTFSLSVSSADESKGLTTSGGKYDEDSEILIYASPKSGYQFDKWKDGNTDNPRTVKMTGDLAFVAYFVAEPTTYTLTASSTNMTQGSVLGGGNYKAGESVTIAAIAKSGFSFTQWNDGNTDNPRTIVMNNNTTYFASFAPVAAESVKYTLTTSSTNAAQGTAYGQGTYEAGTQIAIFAVANEGFHFTQWHDGNTENPRMVTLAADAMYFANFAQDPVAPTLYDLNVAPENTTQGWTTESCAYEFGTQVMIYAHPAAGYQFDQWSDGNKDNPRFLTITAEVNLTAKFAVKSGTGVSAVNSTDTQAQKIVRDGQVYVLRGDKLYTLQGQEAK